MVSYPWYLPGLSIILHNSTSQQIYGYLEIHLVSHHSLSTFTVIHHDQPCLMKFKFLQIYGCLQELTLDLFNSKSTYLWLLTGSEPNSGI